MNEEQQEHANRMSQQDIRDPKLKEEAANELGDIIQDFIMDTTEVPVNSAINARLPVPEELKEQEQEIHDWLSEEVFTFYL